MKNPTLFRRALVKAGVVEVHPPPTETELVLARTTIKEAVDRCETLKAQAEIRAMQIVRKVKHD